MLFTRIPIRLTTLSIALLGHSVCHAQTQSITAAGFSAAWGTSDPNYDLNGDGVVNGTDLSLYLSNGTASSSQTSTQSGTSSSSDTNQSVVESVNPFLIPGSGFVASTPVPPQVGNASLDGFDATAIARWSDIPYADVQEIACIGVVAFHMNGIESVRFSANAGPWIEVREPSLNPSSLTFDYFTQFRAADFAPGLVEIRAIVTPKTAGLPRVLQGTFANTRPGASNSLAFRNGMHSMFVNARPQARIPLWVSPTGNDSSGDGSTTQPFRTIERAATRLDHQYGGADGCTVMLMPGDYNLGSPSSFGAPANRVRTTNRYLTVQAAPGVPIDAVRLTGCVEGGLSTRLLRFRGVTFWEFSGIRTKTSIDSFLWVDGCNVSSSDRFLDTGGLATSGWSGIYATNCAAREVRHSFRSATFVRQCTVQDFSETPFSADATILNCSVDNYCKYQTDHADVIHWFWNSVEPRENRIVFGLKATRFRTQGLFAGPIPTGCQRLDNVALVNIHISQDANVASGSWWQLDTNHLLLWNVQLPDQPLRFSMHAQRDVGGSLLIRNASIRNSIFQSLHGPQVPQGASVMRVHLISPVYGHVVPQGTDVTLGWNMVGGGSSGTFVNPSALDYRPRIGGAAHARVPLGETIVPVRLDGSLDTIPTMAPLGAFAIVAD